MPFETRLTQEMIDRFKATGDWGTETFYDLLCERVALHMIDVRIRSSSETPSTLPNRKSLRSRCTPSFRLIQEIPITPMENIAVNTMPIAASFFVFTLCWIQVIQMAAVRPASGQNPWGRGGLSSQAWTPIRMAMATNA